MRMKPTPVIYLILAVQIGCPQAHAEAPGRPNILFGDPLAASLRCLNVIHYFISMNRTHTGLGTCTLAFVGDNSPVD